MKNLVCALLILGVSSAVLANEPEPTKATPAKVIELIQKKNFDAFVEQMEGDPNQPDDKGRLALVEAVKSRQIKFVDSLLQFFAMAQVKEPASGSTPVHYAFQGGLVDIAKLLVAYGADLNATDKNGRKPRDFTPNAELKEIVKTWDEKGPLAFEDAPGTWIKSKSDKGDAYWFNVVAQEARWNKPPSAAWQRILFQGHPAHYYNSVTGQQVVHIPPALSWRKVRVEGKDPVWYNWAVNISQTEVPDEMPNDMLAEAEKDLFNTRWYNEVTKEYSFVNPKYHTTWREVTNEDGQLYYFNVETGESSWDVPAELAWVEESSDSGHPYYFNKVTGESSWEKPVVKGWSVHTHDFEEAAASEEL